MTKVKMITILPIMKNNGELNSPFRYAGGKFYARKLILKHIPDHNTYIEPFAGGASIFFAKEKVEFNILNDIDKELINALIIIRDNPNALIESLTINDNTLSFLPDEFVRKELKGDQFLPIKIYIIFLKIILNQIVILRRQVNGII